MRYLLGGLSLAVSVAFCWGGIFMVLAQGFPDSPIFVIVAALLAAYGVASALLLVLAWRGPQRKHRNWAIWLAVLPVLVWLGGSLDTGHLSGLEILSTLGVLAVLAIQILAVRSVTSAAQQGAPADPPRPAGSAGG